MERVDMLREQARVLRLIAAKSGELPEVQSQIIELASCCEKLIESVTESVPAQRRQTAH